MEILSDYLGNKIWKEITERGKEEENAKAFLVGKALLEKEKRRTKKNWLIKSSYGDLFFKK